MSWSRLEQTVPIVLAVALLFCLLTFAFFAIPSGLGSSRVDYFSLQADALRDGVLWISVGASPASCVMDGSWYAGQCFLYWGIVPAVFHLALPVVSDRVFAIAACAVATYFLLRILLRTARRLAGTDPPDPLVVLPIALFLTFGTGLAPTALLGWVYGESICFAFAFGLAGVWCLLPLAQRERIESLSIGRVVGGAVLLSLAALTRAPWFLVVVAVGLLGLSTDARALTRAPARRPVAALVCVFGLAFAIQAGLNQARFDSPFDFGVAHVYPNPEAKDPKPDQAHYSATAAPFNLMTYFVTGLPGRAVSHEDQRRAVALPYLTRLGHSSYHTEFPIGLLVAMPGLVLALPHAVRLRRAGRLARLGAMPWLLSPIALLLLVKEHQMMRYQLEVWLPVLMVAVPVLFARSADAKPWEGVVHWASLAVALGLSLIAAQQLIIYRHSWL